VAVWKLCPEARGQGGLDQKEKLKHALSLAVLW
jgi:hypothetical protein